MNHTKGLNLMHIYHDKLSTLIRLYLSISGTLQVRKANRTKGNLEYYVSRLVLITDVGDSYKGNAFQSQNIMLLHQEYLMKSKGLKTININGLSLHP